MSPPISSQHATPEMRKSYIPVSPNFNSSENFDFLSFAGFPAPEKSNTSTTRSRPRLTKIRRKQNEKSVKLDLGLNGFSDASGEVKVDGKLVGNAFGGSNGNSENGVLNGSSVQFRNSDGGGLGCGLNLGDSVFGLGMEKGNSCFGASMNSSASNRQSLDGYFSFKSDKGSSKLDLQNENRTFVFGPSKSGLARKAESGSNGLDSNFSTKVSTRVVDQQKSNFEFVFGSREYDPDSNVKLDNHETQKSGQDSNVNEFGKVNNACFVFGAKNASAVNNLDQRKQDSAKNKDKVESGEDARNTIPDMMGKVKLDIPGVSEKVYSPCFKFPSNWSNHSKENHVNFVFGSNNNDSRSCIDSGNKLSSESGDGTNDRNCGKVNANIEIKFQNACFSGLHEKAKASTKNVNEVNQLNKGNAEDCDDSTEHDHSIGSDVNAKFKNGCNSHVSLEEDLLYKLSNKMKKLNIDGSEAEADETQKFTCNLSFNVNDVFVFGSSQNNSGSIKENHQKGKTPDVTHLSQNNTKSNRTSSSFFSMVGDGIQLNDSFCEVPSTDKGDKEGYSFTTTLEGLDSSNADYSTPNLKFALSNLNVDKKTDKAINKYRRGKKSKNTNGKLGKKTLVHDLFGQDHPSEEGSSQQNQNTPGYGSPMEFSPYQVPSACNAQPELKKEEFTANEKDNSEQCAKPHDDEKKSNLSPPLHAQDGLSAIRRQYKKKYKLKVGLSHTVQGNKSDKIDNEQGSASPANEVCEVWRTRGNQAYHAGKLSKAEEFYSNGINSVQHASALGYSMEPLLLCYSNRAATRMTLGRMREAIDDCTRAAALDPNFLKVSLRAGNCYLVLGEVDDAILWYNKCLGSGSGVCLDRKITIEAADGIQKAKRVAEYTSQSAKLLQEGTHDAAKVALDNIAEALSISRYSEGLLEMKGEALCILRMYEEVIKLCEQTLPIAKKNFPAHHPDDSSYKKSHVSLWRWQLQTKSHYHLGRLDLALDMIEKQEKIPFSSTSGNMTRETSIALAATIRELLRLKVSGNDAFHSGKYSEAVEHYTAAISKSIDSRPFMAICFCNRAAANQSIGQIIDAIADCSLAIALDENYQKAISRRATLHEMIRDYKQAAHDLERLISLLESQSQPKTQEKQYDSQSRSSGGTVRDLRKARRQLSLIEEKSINEIPLDLYLILGIKASETESEIKRAYRKAALKHHPDKAGQVLARSDVGDVGTLWKEVCEKIHKDADRLFKIIGEAYAVLSDPSKRSKYDDEEERRNVYNNRNSNCEHPSTSYSSPYGKGRQAGTGFSASSDRNNSRRYWSESKSSRWW
ncbi:hypothetical protein ACJIZ3_005663 [Penstemon smallii]|uniref:J domain-containing protein n=1 Tax=Penstemon smallii TaxID=265156 RepID=A0ABD3S5J5_9LAMI